MEDQKRCFTQENRQEYQIMIIPTVVTICTKDRKCIFGDAGRLNDFGMIAKNELSAIETHYDNIIIDKYVVMPNHIHAIIAIENSGKHSLNTVIGQYKSGVTRKIREFDQGRIVWQRSYHDHVIRTEKQYLKIWEYIDNNPIKWELDCYFVRIREGQDPPLQE